jgi:hypothetical protein
MQSTGTFSPAHESAASLASSPSWRVTVSDWHTANRISHTLGGHAQRADTPDREHWELTTKSASLAILVGGLPDSDISFRIASLQELGFFRLFSKSQTLTQTLIREVREFPTATLRILSIEPVLFTTRNGITVTYLRPVFTPTDYGPTHQTEHLRSLEGQQ